jgi:hypothetical protein
MTQEEFARRAAAFWAHFDVQQRRRNRVILVQVLVTLLLLGFQVASVCLGWLPSESNYVWMALIVGWGIFCILWMRWVNKEKFEWTDE